MNDNKFLKKDTKIFSVVTSVLLGIALLTLVVIGLVGGNFLGISVIGSTIIVFVAGIFMGSMQIRVFSDYKSQKKYLCADGIFYISLTAITAITALIYLFVKDAQIDLRYFIFVFALAFAIWKVIISVISFKKKHFNAFAELLIAICWIIDGVAVLLTALNVGGSASLYMLCVSNYLLGALTIFYLLYSYIFNEPKYLETKEALAIQEKENFEKQQRLNRFNSRFENFAQNQSNTQSNKDKSSIEEKLEKLKSLKEKGFLNEEEYEEKRKKLLDENL